MEISIYSQEGKVVEKLPVSKEIFEVPVKEDLIHRSLVMQLSNSRRPIAHTKTRSERAGSTRKLTRQKGLGAARKGPARSPVTRKGGIAFGPRNTRNFTKNMTKQERRGALFSALSSKAKDNAIVGLENYQGEISTKNFLAMIKKLSLPRKVLVVLPEKNNIVQKSSNNIASVKTILVNYLNVRDILQYQNILFFKEALLKLDSIFLKK